jgi:hypothetical protein
MNGSSKLWRRRGVQGRESEGRSVKRLSTVQEPEKARKTRTFSCCIIDVFQLMGSLLCLSNIPRGEGATPAGGRKISFNVDQNPLPVCCCP